MNVINDRRNELTGIPFLNNALDGLISRINLVFRAEHTDDGAHTDVTAETLEVSGDTTLAATSVTALSIDDVDLDAEALGPETFVESGLYPTVSATADVTKAPLAIAGDLVPAVDDTSSLGYQGIGVFIRRWRDVYVSRVVHAARIVGTVGVFSEGVQVLSSAISVSVTSDQNDWSPTGLASARVIRLQTDASRRITGVAAQSAGTVLTIINVDTPDAVLVHESGLSTAANRIICPGGVNYTLTVGSAATLWYDGVSPRWRFLHS